MDGIWNRSAMHPNGEVDIHCDVILVCFHLGDIRQYRMCTVSVSAEHSAAEYKTNILRCANCVTAVKLAASHNTQGENAETRVHPNCHGCPK